MDPKTEHHPFCNYFAQKREGCRQCETMYAKFPMEPGMMPDDLITKYFPDVRRLNDGRPPQP